LGRGFVPTTARVEVKEFAGMSAAVVAGAVDEEAPVSYVYVSV
jgi:hypothetical protein